VAVKVPPIVIKFGAGLNSRARLSDVNIEETSLGENFDLDAKNSALRPRRPFKKIVQTPNGVAATATDTTPLLGYAQLRKRNGTVDQIVQCASVVYHWNGATTFSTLAELSASDSKIRGRAHHNWGLATYVIVTDLEKQEDVQFWDGATATGFQTLPTGLTNLKAKYAHVLRERVILANLTENSVDLSHMTVFSKVSTATTYSVSDKPSSALGLDDAVYMLTPNLRPINGLDVAFGDVVYSTEKDRLFVLSGDSSFDFAFGEFYDNSNASGDESVVNIGNDLLFGRSGAIDILSSTIKYGDVEVDDVSRWIKENIERTESWTNVYDQRNQRVICFPNNQSAAYVLHKDIFYEPKHSLDPAPRMSPWSRWRTTYPTGFSPTVVWAMTDPIDGYESVYFGDSSGNIYKFDPEDTDLDAASDVVTVTRRSKLINLPEAMQLFDIEGWIDYTKQWEATVQLNFIFGGEQSPTTSITLTLPGSDSIGHYYNSSNASLQAVYNNDDYYRAGYDFSIRRQNWKVAGQGNTLQVECIVSSSGRDWQIEEIGLRIHASA